MTAVAVEGQTAARMARQCGANELRRYAPMMPSDQEWQAVASLTDVPSAQVLAQRLIFEGVPARVVSDAQLFGEGRNCEVQVPSALAHRARWLMSQAQFTDAELTFLATGELNGDDSAEQ
jgi:hypothetical protein